VTGPSRKTRLKASLRGAVPAFIALEVLREANERAAAGAEIVHLEIGQPSTAAPRAVVEAAKLALDTHQIGYTESLGLPILRSRIARHYRDFYDVEVDPARVVVTTGSSGAFLLGFLAAFDAGDRVALAAPGYPAYRNILLALDLVPVSLPTGPETSFQPTVELLESLDTPVDGLIVASPANPTGTMLRGDELRRLCDYCSGHGIRLVSDEIYHGITFGEPPVTAAGLGPDAIVVNSFSKYFSMTGWRLGWMIAPEALSRPLESLAQNLFISPPTLPQYAAMAVFDCRDELDANVRRYARNRELLLAGLPAAGFDRLTPPDGAFYLFADVSRLTNDSHELCRRMLAEAGVAATPGVDLDTERGHRFLRFSFAGSTADMEQAVRRLAAWRR
jgi:aspartate/methionine/tyrosine aminotransferase